MRYPDFDDAACRGLDVEMFFLIDPEDRVQNRKDLRYLDIPMLKKMCKGCPVRQSCFEWALHHEKYGYWAGTTERDREKLRVKLNINLVLPQLLGFERNTVAK